MFIYKLLTGISAITTLGFSIFAYRRRKVRAALIFSVLMLLITLYTISSYMELMAIGLDKKFLWRKVSQSLALLVFPITLLMTIKFTERQMSKKLMAIFIISIIPLIGIILVWTDRTRKIMTQNIFLEGQFLVIERTPIGKAIAFFNYFIIIIAIIILIIFYKKANKGYRNQAIGLISALIVPMLVVVVKEASPQIAEMLPPTVVFISVSGFFLFWSIFRYKLFSAVPIARDKVMEVIKEGIIVIDEFGRVIDKNAAVDSFIKEVINIEYDITGLNINILLSSFPQWLSACRDMNETQIDIETSTDGNNGFYRVKVYPLLAKNSEKRGTVSIIFDINNDKIKENNLISKVEQNEEHIIMQAEKLSENEKQLEAIFENMYDTCVVFDKDGNYTRINKAAKELILKLHKKQVECIKDLYGDSDFYDINNNKLNLNTIPAYKVINGEKVKNERIVFKKGIKELHFNVNGTPIYNENGDFLFGIICKHDVTELVLKNVEVEKKWIELKKVLENMNDAIYVIDAIGNYKFLNNTAKVFFDNKELKKLGDGCLYSHFYDIEGKEVTVADLPEQKVLRGNTINAERLKNIYSGYERYIDVSGTPVHNDDGSIQYAVISYHEVTDIIQRQQIIDNQQKKFLEAEIEKNKALQNEIDMIKEIDYLSELNSLNDKLLTIFTHDIRNPMATMISLMELLEVEKGQFSEDIREIIIAVNEQVTNTYNTVESMMDWLKSNREGLIYNPLIWNLMEIVQEAVSLCYISAEKKKISIERDIDEDINVFADKEMFEIVLRNLLLNAIKFTYNDGLILIRSYRSGDEIIVLVKDTGIGIDRERIKTIFNKTNASSTKGTAGEKGAGLGLLICGEFVSQNGGRMWVDSTPGKGSTFYFSILSADNDNHSEAELKS